MDSIKHEDTLIRLPVSDATQTIEDTEMSSLVSLPSVTITMTSSTPVPFHSHRTLKKSYTTVSGHEPRQTRSEKGRLEKELSLTGVSRRLSRRKDLHQRCSIVSDVMCAVGLLGVVLMIIENELTFVHVDHHDTIATWFIKLAITISTTILVGLVFCYHYFQMRLFCVNNSIPDWRIAFTHRQVFLITLEVLVCAVHPFPRYYPVDKSLDGEINDVNSTIPTPTPFPLTYIPVDVGLGVPMFGRLYLLCRFITFHSHLVRDASSQSLGYLNQVSINFHFVIKTYMEEYPGRSLVIFCTICFAIGSWSLHACNFKPHNEHLPMLDSMWLFIVTFTTVGYGDILPSTYYGRTVAAGTGIIGITVSSLLIAVVAQKLMLSRFEKYVHNFVLNTELAKARKDQAANIIKYALKVWIIKRKYKQETLKRTLAQRRLFEAILLIQTINREQRTLVDNCVGPAELLAIQRTTRTRTDETAKEIATIKRDVNQIKEQLVDINRTMQTTLNLLLNRAM